MPTLTAAPNPATAVALLVLGLVGETLHAALPLHSASATCMDHGQLGEPEKGHPPYISALHVVINQTRTSCELVSPPGVL